MRQVAHLMMASLLAIAGSALLVTGCGGSSGGNSPDAATDTNMGQHDTGGPMKDSGTDSAKDGGVDTGCLFPTFVINLINNDTKSTASPVPIPPCPDNPPGATQNAEFDPLFK